MVNQIYRVIQLINKCFNAYISLTSSLPKGEVLFAKTILKCFHTWIKLLAKSFSIKIDLSSYKEFFKNCTAALNNFTKITKHCLYLKVFNWHLKLSRGEVCVAIFIPPANNASLGSYLSQNDYFGQNQAIIEVKISNRQTDRQTDKFFDTIYGGCVDFLFKLNLLPSYSLCSQGDK